jgi:hypothetical protein
VGDGAWGFEKVFEACFFRWGYHWREAEVLFGAGRSKQLATVSQRCHMLLEGMRRGLADEWMLDVSPERASTSISTAYMSPN